MTVALNKFHCTAAVAAVDGRYANPTPFPHRNAQAGNETKSTLVTVVRRGHTSPYSAGMYSYSRCCHSPSRSSSSISYITNSTGFFKTRTTDGKVLRCPYAKPTRTMYASILKGKHDTPPVRPSEATGVSVFRLLCFSHYGMLTFRILRRICVRAFVGLLAFSTSVCYFLVIAIC